LHFGHFAIAYAKTRILIKIRVEGVGMIIGIVGAGQDKLTVETEAVARATIRKILRDNPTATITSGHSKKKGIDIIVEEEFYLNRTTGGLWIRAPIIEAWPKQGEGYGYKARNTDIAKADLVVVFVVKEYPPEYKFEDWEPKTPYYYHCKDKREPHVKSGGCWTGLKAIELGHQAFWYLL